VIKRVNFASLLLTLVTAAGNVGLGKPRDATDCTVAELTPVTIIAKSESTLRASSGLTLAVGGLTCSGKAGVSIVMIVPIDVVIIGKVVDNVTDIAGPYPAAVKPAAVLADVAVVQAATAAVAAPNIIIADISFP
tara:strand:- start:332 stop:736 length:405 start_codon:yes stop_codon:yes gene_type:complete